MKGTWNTKKHIHTLLIYLRLGLISLEFVSIILIIIICYRKPVFFTHIWQLQVKLPETIQWLPITFCLPAYYLTSKIISLETNEDNKLLYKWDMYKHIKAGAFVALLYVFLPIACLIIAHLNIFNFKASTLGAIFIISLIIPCITIITLYLAKLKLREYFVLYK